MPVGALTEILERGQLSVLYRGLLQQDAEEIDLAFGVPTKKLMVSRLASLNVLVMSPRWADRRKAGAGRPTNSVESSPFACAQGRVRWS